MLALEQVTAGEGHIGEGVVLVQPHGSLADLEGPLQVGLPVRWGPKDEVYIEGIAETRVGRGECRILFDGALEKGQGPLTVLDLVLIGMPKAALIIFPGIEAFRRFAQRTLTLAAGQLRLDGGDDGMGQLVLDGEDVFQVAVIALGPDMLVLSSIDQLGGHPHPLARTPDTSFQDIAHP